MLSGHRAQGPQGINDDSIFIRSLSERIPVQFSDTWPNTQHWSARIHPGSVHSESVTMIQSTCHTRPNYKSISERLWLGVHGHQSKCLSASWSFGQYEPGVLEACLTLLEVSPQHLSDENKDNIQRADPVYLSRVVCAMLAGHYEGGVNPTEWSGSADILRRWVSSNFSPVALRTVLGLCICPLHRNFQCVGECWMSRPDLSQGLMAGRYILLWPMPCSRCSAALPQCPIRHLVIFASVDADVIRLLYAMECGGRMVDSELVGQGRNLDWKNDNTRMDWEKKQLHLKDRRPSGLEVSLYIKGKPSFGESIGMSVKVTNNSSEPRVLVEHVRRSALTLQHTIPASEYESVLAADGIVNIAVVIKDVRTKERVLDSQEFNISSPQISIEPQISLMCLHVFGTVGRSRIPRDNPKRHRSKDGDSIQINKEHTVQVSFTNELTKTLTGAVLTSGGIWLVERKHEASPQNTKLRAHHFTKSRHLLSPKFIEARPAGSFKARREDGEYCLHHGLFTAGTKVLMATFSHSSSPSVVSRIFHKVSIIEA
ncbi:unnamed protein product [Pleuronectes platessa]|uniref:Uncharacterized protein n=1 Tax=Pleuronectes platessa TaxID=8262 RepID=A0A9N7Y452_PLEPL|nr:unnamed protein product [Pleuronectes platessa]